MALRAIRRLSLGVFVGVLTACGGSVSPGGPATPSSVPTTTPSVVPSTTPVGKTATCPPGSDPDVAGPAQQARPRFADWSRSSAAFDRQSGRVVHVDSQGDTWTLDVCTNTWTRPSTRGEAPGEGAYFFYDAVTDRTYALSEGDTFPVIRTYDVESSTWSPVSPPRGLPMWQGPDPRFVLDPSERVIYGYQTTTGQLRAYGIAANTWTDVGQGEPHPPANPDMDGLAAFDPTAGRMVLYLQGPHEETTNPETWTFHPGTRTWTRVVTAATPLFNFGWGIGRTEMTYNEASRNSVVVPDDGSVAGFSATANEWIVPQEKAGWPVPQAVTSTAGPLVRHGHGVVDDTVNGRVLVLGGSVSTTDPRDETGMDWPGMSWQEGTDVWAYDVAASTWTELVPQQPKM